MLTANVFVILMVAVSATHHRPQAKRHRSAVTAVTRTAQRHQAPPPGCRRYQIRRMQRASNAQIERQRFVRARVLLERLVDHCEPVLSRFQRIWIRNDLAMAQHYSGDDSSCIRTLMPLRRYAEESPEQLSRRAPQFIEAYRHIGDATRANFELCGEPDSVSSR